MDHPRAADLFERHHLTLFHYVCRSTGRRDVAEDVVQDVFVRVLRGLESYEPIGRDLAWLFAITRRLLLDRHRALARRPEEVLLPSEPSAAVDQEGSAVLAQALGRIPFTDREPFLLREVGGLTYDEIAWCAISPWTPCAPGSTEHASSCDVRWPLQNASTAAIPSGRCRNERDLRRDVVALRGRRQCRPRPPC